MVLHQSRMGQLDANSVVHGDKDEEKRVSNEVLLPIVTKQLVMLAGLLADLNWCHVDWLVTDESTAEPNSNPDPEAKELDQQGEQINVFNLRWEWCFP